jgi:altronate dehydratase small subunit
MTSNMEGCRVLMIMHPQDNVAVCLRKLEEGEQIPLIHQDKDISVKVLDSVPLGHKISLLHIALGQAIIKYGEIIGQATKDIIAGQHVHDHNISDY